MKSNAIVHSPPGAMQGGVTVDYNNYGGMGGNDANYYQKPPMAQQILPAMSYGAGVGFSALGYSISVHKPWRTFGFWSAIVGAVMIVWWIMQALAGGAMGAVNKAPLPNDTPATMRFGHAVSRGGSPIVSNTAKGIAVGLDQGVRAQYTEVADNQSFYRTPRSGWEATNTRR